MGGGEDEAKVYTLLEVTKHSSREDCWIIINGKVFRRAPFHPHLINYNPKTFSKSISSAIFNTLDEMQCYYICIRFASALIRWSQNLCAALTSSFTNGSSGMNFTGDGNMGWRRNGGDLTALGFL
ncbi:Cytochrome b5 isoform B [Platanthera guangdongensis]|uniref:Cytochrome b5 isoform B n=1 Tax=Platanthera guangdongensis TaxID=2320717 RepID=A0ABR2M5E9_9ASPA